MGFEVAGLELVLLPSVALAPKKPIYQFACYADLKKILLFLVGILIFGSLGNSAGQLWIMGSDLSPPSPTSFLRLLVNLDTAVSLHLFTFFQPILPYSLLKSLELSGDGRIFFPIILAVLLMTAPLGSLISPGVVAQPTLLLINLLIGSLLDLIFIGLIKHLIQRPRPVYNKNMSLSFAVDHWSFPSGHSSRVSFIATFCFFYSDQIKYVVSLSPLNFDAESVIMEYFVLAVGLWAAVTSISRVLLGRHFVFDVVAGMCLGVLEGVIVFGNLNYDKLSSWFR